MRLASGSTLGTYEVLSLLGTGGMGEVYRARDTRLGREVAIKVLPADRLADEDRRRRFVQEAQAASALNHPHIITIHEIESADGHDFIVMEYVRGKSLDALIPRQGMRLAEVLRIAIPVADAVAAAHARGIIHRDLKPANVIVGTEGAVKVLDFGLAKLTAHDADPEEQTVTHVVDPTLSVPGTVVGTAAYMSPEQATGGRVDARSDIFAFGAMLYEMVTGARAFPGGSTTETLTAVLRAEPKRPSALSRRCAARPRKSHSAVPAERSGAPIPAYRRREGRAGGDQGGVGIRRRHGPARSPTTSLDSDTHRHGRHLDWSAQHGCFAPRTDPDIKPLRVVPLTALSGRERLPTFSPDGNQLAFVYEQDGDNRGDIYMTMVGSPEVRRLTTDPAGDGAPSWSPDGRQIAFVSDRPQAQQPPGRIYLISPLGGPELKVSDFAVNTAPVWTPDGRHLIVGRSPSDPAGGGDAGLYLVSLDGRKPTQLTQAKTPVNHRSAAISPDGRHLAYVACLDWAAVDATLRSRPQQQSLASRRCAAGDHAASQQN